MRTALWVLPMIVTLVAVPRAGAQTTLPYDHIHMNVPDPAAAAAWYEKNFGAKRLDEGPDRLMFGTTRMLFAKRADAKPSVGSVIDHIGFSVADLDAKMKALEAAGVKIVSPVRDVPGVFKIAFVEDPWGTRIEVVQDPELLGFHHLHLRAPDVEQMFTWLHDEFGGERTKLKGRLDAMKYRAPGFNDVWVLVQKGDATASDGHAVDHLGWRAAKLTDLVTSLKGKGVKVTAEPRSLAMPNKTTIQFGFVEGPAGLKIELVERPGLRPGE